PLLVEIQQAQRRVIGARRPFGDRASFLVGELPVATGQAPPELLTVDMDGFPAAVLVLDAARHAFRERGGEALRKKVIGFDQMRVTRVRPDHLHNQTSWSWRDKNVRGRRLIPTDSNTTIYECQPIRKRSFQTLAARRRLRSVGPSGLQP